ncbi:hypothetical protein CK203_048008 [Vitis vinifera]|uniref:Uncharacterized protein n=1 Tax=Vitis vinifera TaxID=29760 RepID=A0A438GH65_VITVI|nr:hypothetical protein CK203_048008 [Vitis vinifera]
MMLSINFWCIIWSGMMVEGATSWTFIATRKEIPAVLESPKEAACLLMDNGGRKAFPMVESYAEVVNKGKQEFSEEIWVQGLPLHLWGEEFFKRLGDACQACGGFIAIDEETSERQLLQWARIVVKSNRKKVLRKLHVVVKVVSKERCKIPKMGDDGEDFTRMGGRVGREEESHVEGVYTLSTRLQWESCPQYALMRPLDLLGSEDKVGGSWFEVLDPSVFQALQVKGSSCVTSQPSKGIAKGLLGN